MIRAIFLMLILAPALAAADPTPEESRAFVEKELGPPKSYDFKKSEEASVRISELDPFPAEIVAEFIEDPDVDRRRTAIRALEYAGKRAKAAARVIGEALKASVASKRPDMQRELLNALRAQGSSAAAAIPAILDLIASRQIYVNREIGYLFLYSLGEEGRRALRGVLADKDPERVQAIFTVLEEHGGSRALAALFEDVLRDEVDPVVRLAAARAAHIKSFEPNRIFPMLRRALLEDMDPAVRVECATALPDVVGNDGDLIEDALVVLRASAKEDPDDKARAAAAKSLAALELRR